MPFFALCEANDKSVSNVYINMKIFVFWFQLVIHAQF